MFAHHVAAIVIGMYLLIIGEGVISYWEHTFSPHQIRKYRCGNGLPWIAHCGASWGDFFLVGPVVAVLLGKYGSQWHPEDHILQILIVWIANGALHYQWAKNRSIDPIACRGRLMWAGLPHFLYMGIGTTFIVFFYFDTKGIDPVVLKRVSAILAIHIALGCHVALSAWNLLAKALGGSVLKPLKWWRVNTLKDPAARATMFGCWLALLLRSYWILSHE